MPGLEVSGGGLDHPYQVLQFHLHWGDAELHPGSEHTLNDHRYPMEVSLLPHAPTSGIFLMVLMVPSARITRALKF